MVSAAIHLVGVACFGFSLAVHLGLGKVELPEHVTSSKTFKAMNAYPGMWKFLTVWDIVIQLVYHSVALLNDLFGTSKTTTKGQSVLQMMRDELFGILAFPIGVIVSSVFWGLYAIDRELIFPKEVDAFYPNWLNHAVHTAPIALILLELFTTPKVHPGRPSLPANIGFTVIYLTWITYVYTQVGTFPYPILNLVPKLVVGVLFATTVAGIAAFYILGQKLTEMRWSAAEDPKARSPKSAKGKGKKKSKKA